MGRLLDAIIRAVNPPSGGDDQTTPWMVSRYHPETGEPFSYERRILGERIEIANNGGLGDRGWRVPGAYLTRPENNCRTAQEAMAAVDRIAFSQARAVIKALEGEAPQ